jgi:peptidoglycan hydrolase-like protein with peptidoglycan-binding domain
VDLIVPPAGLPAGASDAVRGGHDVAHLQDCLVALGYLTAEGVAGGKGNFGPKTQAAVGRFQRDQGIDNTGAVGRFGPKTRAAMADAITKLQQPKLEAIIQNAYQDVLGHPPAQGDFLVERAHQALELGKWPSEIDSYLRTELKATGEYRLAHLDEVVRDTYRDVLQRDADPGGMETWLQVANDLKAQGKGAAEISQTLAEKFRASAEYAQLPPGPWQKVPYVNQYNPAGRENGYTNGPSNCGPTSMAMLARAFGYRPDLADAQLINHLGKIGGTTVDGSSWNGIVAMADAMGKSATTHSGKDPEVINWVKAQLGSGKAVVANGNFYAMQPHATSEKSSGHYVLVTGMDKQGNFLVEDPADRNVHSVSPANLQEFFRTHSWGGGAIAIG